MMPAVTVGELVTAPFEFSCLAKHHGNVEEVRLSAIRRVADRRYLGGFRVVLEWSGYCPGCGRRVQAAPLV